MLQPFLADIGIPMIFVQWPLMLYVLLPVIVIETEVVRRQLSLTYGNAVAGAAKANVISTLIGVPSAWAIMLAVEFATLYPLSLAAEKWHWNLHSPFLYILNVLAIAWTNPPGTSLWPVALAATLLLIPTFFVSVWLERRVYRRSYRHSDAAIVDRSVWFANLASYGLLFVVACGWVGWEICYGGEKAPVVKRLLQEHPIDFAYLQNAVVSSSDADACLTFDAAISQLEGYLADFDAMMRDVEQGKITVRKNLSRDRWESAAETADSWTSIDYDDRLGPVESVQKHQNKHPFHMIYQFKFNSAGYITEARTPPGSFLFDERGRLRHWRQEKWDAWGKRE
jgi:hypothetical protein